MPLIPSNATSAVSGGPYPEYHSNSANKFIPAIWSGQLISKSYPATVVGDVANTKYQGEISRMGDTVIIRQTPDGTVDDYEKGQTLVYEFLEADAVILEINRAKTFQCAIDDIDVYQSDIDLISDWAEEYAHRLAEVIDVDYLATTPLQAADGAGVSGGATALGANFGATAGFLSQTINLGAAGAPVALDRTTVIDYFVNMGLVLDERNVPRDGRRNAVIPNSMAALIKRSDLTDASYAGDSVSMSRRDFVGQIDGTNIYRSNLLSGDNTAGWNIMMSHESASTFAMQILKDKMDYFPDQRTHGHLMRGLAVYGFKTLKPDHMAWGVVTASL